MGGNFVGRIKGAKYRFDLQFPTWDVCVCAPLILGLASVHPVPMV